MSIYYMAKECNGVLHACNMPKFNSTINCDKLLYY